MKMFDMKEINMTLKNNEIKIYRKNNRNIRKKIQQIFLSM